MVNIDEVLENSESHEEQFHEAHISAARSRGNKLLVWLGTVVLECVQLLLAYESCAKYLPFQTKKVYRLSIVVCYVFSFIKEKIKRHQLISIVIVL